MRNYLNLGPVSIRVSRRHLAAWGFPLISIGGLQLFTRDTGGRMTLASYHPRNCTTWHWAVGLWKRVPGDRSYRAEDRRGQWHDYYALPFGWMLVVSQQNWHSVHRNIAH